MKLATNIHHASGRTEKFFKVSDETERSKTLGLRLRELCEYSISVFISRILMKLAKIFIMPMKKIEKVCKVWDQ